MVWSTTGKDDSEKCVPLSPMSIRALEVGTAGLLLWRNIPTTTTLVGNKGKTVVGGDILDKKRVLTDRM